MTPCHAAQIYFFATEGTLLGAVRDKTWFMPIVKGSRGTQDFDFGIRWDDYVKHFQSTTGGEDEKKHFPCPFPVTLDALFVRSNLRRSRQGWLHE